MPLEHTQAETGSRRVAVVRGLPPRNPAFTGRAETLAQVGQRLKEGVTALVPTALHGMGGVGKTQLAVEYAYRQQHRYDLVGWIPAEQPDLARAALTALAGDLGVPPQPDAAGRVCRRNTSRGAVSWRWS